MESRNIIQAVFGDSIVGAFNAGEIGLFDKAIEWSLQKLKASGKNNIIFKDHVFFTNTNGSYTIKMHYYWDMKTDLFNNQGRVEDVTEEGYYFIKTFDFKNFDDDYVVKSAF